MKYLSLFSGIGGFELGIQQAYEENFALQQELRQQKIEGQENNSNISHKRYSRNGEAESWKSRPTCIGYSEIDKYAIQVYNKHFNHKNYGDITKIKPEDLPDFDLLVGGFPCQAFSIAGKRKGFEDTRGTLFFEIARIAKEKQPRLLLLENVKGLLSHDKGSTFFTIISTLDELGYDCEWQVLNSKNFGVPQNRERVFIVGHLRRTSRPEVFPIKEVCGISSKCGQERETKGGIASTITKNYHKGVHSGGETYAIARAKIRRLTPKECERLQGFPDDWTIRGVDHTGDIVDISDTQRYKMCGNAVTVNVIKEIMIKLL